MATKQVLNPKYQTNWAFFNKVKNKITEIKEAVKQEVVEEKQEETVDEQAEPLCPVCGQNPCICGEGDAQLTAEKEDVKAEEIQNVADENKVEDDTEESDSVESVESADKVDTFREAQEFMKRAFGLTHKDVISREKLLEQMEAHGVEFPNLTL